VGERWGSPEEEKNLVGGQLQKEKNKMGRKSPTQKAPRNGGENGKKGPAETDARTY